jgi:DNA-binding transcriptional MerR regulator
VSAQAPERSGRHLSIGEVLSRLRGEFPDITISKIRFLESQGLIDPERTPSGYRKFYAPDLTRLRWILFQQRDHFLPLRVIKERLDAFGPDGAPSGSSPANGGSAASQPAAPHQAANREAPAPPVAARPVATAPTPAPEPPPVSSEPARAEAQHVEPEPPILKTSTSAFLEPEPHDAPPSKPTLQEPAPAEPAPPEPVRVQPERAEPPPKPAPPPVVRPPPVVLPFDDFVDKADDDAEVLGPVTRPDDQPANDDLTRAELLEATELSDAQLDALEEFGILAPVAGVGERALYDESALDLAEIAAGFHARGIEARHLKMYWHFAEREGALFAQVLVQYVRQRNPAARARMQEDLEELARLGRRLRSEMLRRALGNSLGE